MHEKFPEEFEEMYGRYTRGENPWDIAGEYGHIINALGGQMQVSYHIQKYKSRTSESSE